MSPGASAREVSGSGVYQIRCKVNGKIYVGSAVSISARWNIHRRDLRKGAHQNPHFQHAWKLYGETNFEFSIVECVGPANLLAAEQRWIDQTRCADRLVGFNVKLEATQSGSGVGRTWVGFCDPTGKPVTIVGLADFCRRHGLDYRSMHRLATGRSKLKCYFGWTHRNSVRQRDYVKIHEGFVDPEGTRIGPIENLAAFCRRHQLDKTHMVAVSRGRIISHRGWTHTLGRRRLPPKVYKGFVAPNGAPVEITNLRAFCRASGLCVVHMHELKSGKRKSHKGWTWSYVRVGETT